MNDRAQTAQDFAVGVSVFLLTVGFVFAFVPSIFAPYDSAVDDDVDAQSDRVGRTLVGNLSTEESQLELNATQSSRYMERYDDGDDLARAVGVPGNTHVNVTIRTLDGEDVVTNTTGAPYEAGDPYQGQAAASTARIVTLDDGTCDPACRLLVRLW